MKEIGYLAQYYEVDFGNKWYNLSKNVCNGSDGIFTTPAEAANRISSEILRDFSEGDSNRYCYRIKAIAIRKGE